MAIVTGKHGLTYIQTSVLIVCMNKRKSLIRTDTKHSIMDAAEYMFARNGYKGTSLRAITGRAGVNLAAVNYHFGSKKVLLEAVLLRRIQPLNLERRRRFEEIRDNARKLRKKPEAELILKAFIEPVFYFGESDPGSKDFITLIGRAIVDPDDTVRKVFHKFMRSIFELLFKMMSEALPGLSRDVIFWRLHFTIGAMAHAMRICSPDMKELAHSGTATDTSAVIEHLIRFVSKGMKARR